MGGNASKTIAEVSDKGPFTFIYFPIEGAGEKVRLAFVLAGIPFEDKRLPFDQWAAYKPKTKFGQVPILQIGDGEELYQSSAQLKYVALAAPASGLYPADDPAKCVLIDEMIGLCGDFQQAWTPCVYANMRPQAYGYDADMPADEKAALVQKLRANFLAETLPRFAGYFAKALDDGKKKFLCGATPTIADCYALPMFRYYTKGIADGIPSDCLKPYPVITAYIDRMMALEPIAKWYADK